MIPKHILFVCGESSGDLLAAELIDTVRQEFTDCHLSALAGDACDARGVESLYPLEKIAVMGIFEVIPALWHLHKAIKTVMKHLDATPDIDLLICVDAFAFTHKVAVAVRQKYPHIKIVKYVAPKLWAWGEKRAKKLIGIYDLILCNLPFEPAFFARFGIKAEFVGHSVLERFPLLSDLDKENYRESLGLKPERQKILLLAGSRGSEISRLLPCLYEVIPHYDADFLMVMPAYFRKKYEPLAPETQNLYFINAEDRFKTFQIADFAIAASGTVSLELMRAHVPTLIIYKMSPLTFWLAQYLVKVPYVSLLNILLNKMVLPEFLQERACYDVMKPDMDALYHKRALYHAQKQAYQEGITHFTVADVAGNMVQCSCKVVSCLKIL